MILYLDFDGVLHAEDVALDAQHRPFLRGPGTLFEHADRLATALAPYPQVAIVLSTNWVRVKSFRYAVQRLPPALRRRVIGATWHSRFAVQDELRFWWLHTSSRYDQIAGDVSRRGSPPWLALDDDAHGWPASALAHLVRCDPLRGLSEPAAVQQLEERLGALCAPAPSAP